MHIIGNGFLARNLADAFGDRHPHVTAFAAGVSSTSVVDPALFDREANLLHETLHQCRREHRTLVFFSTASFAMYGNTDGPAVEDTALVPPSVYGRHKLALEAIVRDSGVAHRILRLSHVVGAHQRRHQLLPGIADQIHDGTVSIYRGASRDLLDVRDLVHVVDRLAEQDAADVVVNVASGHPLPVETVIDRVIERLGRPVTRTFVDSAFSTTEVSLDRVRTLVPDFGPLRFTAPEYLEQLLDRYLGTATRQEIPG